ncbi:hypothetical protein PLESTM_000771200 [Pleodorina starrii]|nr:hypothetical protein PLESTM_000771200 [Pleodorina starrii]
MVKLEDPIQKDDKLHIQNESMLTERETENQEFRCMMLEPHLVSFASAFMDRVASGKPQEPDAKKKHGSQSFMEKSEQNKAVFARMAGVTNTGSPEDFADFADDNYKLLRNGNVHDTTDAALKAWAARLKGSGAIRLLRDKFPWQCSILENVDELLACLPESAGKD